MYIHKKTLCDCTNNKCTLLHLSKICSHECGGIDCSYKLGNSIMTKNGVKKAT